MNRTKSSVSLKNLAMSIKNSIVMDIHKTTKRQFIPLKTARSTLNLHTLKDIKCNEYKGSLRTAESQMNMNNKAYQLQQQIARLQRQLSQMGTHSVRSYQNELEQYDLVVIRIEESRKQQQMKVQRLELHCNRMLMLMEDARSQVSNSEEGIAEREYHEELVSIYRRQYEGQSEFVIKKVNLEIENQQLLTLQLKLCRNLKEQQIEFNKWRETQQYDLNIQKLKSTLTQLRIEMMEVEQAADAESEALNCRKIRQHMCLYIKEYTRHKIALTTAQEMIQGMEHYICREGLSDQFRKLLVSAYSGFVNSSIISLVNDYCRCLVRMESAIHRAESKADFLVFKLSKDKIIQIQHQLGLNRSAFQSNEAEIQSIQAKVYKMMQNDIVPLIEHLRDRNNGQYDMKVIKQKLKELKSQQQFRMKSMAESYRKQLKLENLSCNSQILTTLSHQIISMKDISAGLQIEKEKIDNQILTLEKQKTSIQDCISSAVSLWKEFDRKKKKLKKLNQQLLLYRKDERQKKWELTRPRGMCSTVSHIHCEEKPIDRRKADDRQRTSSNWLALRDKENGKNRCMAEEVDWVKKGVKSQRVSLVHMLRSKVCR